MRAALFSFRRLRSGTVLFVLGALLVCTQIAEVAHAEVECEHEGCALCVGSASDATLDSDAQTLARAFGRPLESFVAAGLLTTCPAREQTIRGPPST